MNSLTKDSYLSQFKGFKETPDVVINAHSSFPVFEFPEIDITPVIIQKLAELNHPRNSVLGKRMESFFEIAINASSRYELIASNLQIISNKKTLGELDYLIFDKQTSKPLHVELVYKVYVYDPGFETEAEKWIGPNRRDSFQQKMDKLKKRQFPLLYSPETSTYLDSLGLKTGDIEQQLCFKAQLYKREKDQPEFKEVNAASLTGHCLGYDEFIDKNLTSAMFYTPKKNEWSSSPVCNDNWVNYSSIKRQIESLFEKGKSPLIWMKTDSGVSRFFVVWW